MALSHYPGGELELFANAHNWKKYYASRIRPYIGGDVLEVGAGRGGTTQVLYTGQERSWTCIEPDPELARQLVSTITGMSDSGIPMVSTGTIADLASDRTFDCILYIDVLEHIGDDSRELRQAAERLRPGGYIVVLSPAHSFLFSEFDRQIGHFRRYNKETLSAAGPASMHLHDIFYLDSPRNHAVARQQTAAAHGLSKPAADLFLGSIRGAQLTPARSNAWLPPRENHSCRLATTDRLVGNLDTLSCGSLRRRS